ncbi:hypothetical protein TW84_21350 [Vibrio neptunius]|nr:hypothetical protein TW84_21350 [Vibrio neptunius]
MRTKLATIFHLIEEASTSNGDKFNPALRIRKREIVRAIYWISYLTTHFRRVAMMSLKESKQSSEKASQSKLSTLYPSFTRQKLSQMNWSCLNTKDCRERAIEILIEKGHIKEKSNPKRFVIHPKYAPTQ